MTEEQRRDRINELGGYQKLFDAISAAVEPWPSKEQCSGISVSVFKFVEALSAPSSPGDGWEPIETAPRDGRHIQAAIIGTSFGFNAGRALPEVQTVVHWFSDPDGPGFYTSVNEQEPQRPFKATHWKHLTYVAAPSPGGDHEA